MKDEGSRNREDRQNGAQGPYLPAENKQQASAQLDNDGDDVANGWHRQSSRRDPGDRGRWTDNFAKAAQEKQHGHQTTTDKCNGIRTPRHKIPLDGQIRSSSARSLQTTVRGQTRLIASALTPYARFASLSSSHASTAPEAPAWSNRIRATSPSFSVRAQSRCSSPAMPSHVIG